MLRLKIIAAIAAVSLTGTVASAQETNALGQCMTLKTTGQDRLIVARWLAAAIASAPQLRGVVSVEAGVKDAQDRELAKLFTRLLTVDCTAEARPLLKDPSSKGIEVASGALGEIAMSELFSNREADAAIGAFAKYLKREDFVGLMP